MGPLHTFLATIAVALLLLIPLMLGLFWLGGGYDSDGKETFFGFPLEDFVLTFLSIYIGVTLLVAIRSAWQALVFEEHVYEFRSSAPHPTPSRHKKTANALGAMAVSTLVHQNKKLEEIKEELAEMDEGNDFGDFG